jgi:ferrous iron transport protein A
MELTADKLEKGREYLVKSLACTGALRRRIIDMGITPGASIILKKKAPLNDPIEFSVRGYELSMRKTEAELIVAVPSGARLDTRNIKEEE